MQLGLHRLQCSFSIFPPMTKQPHQRVTHYLLSTTLQRELTMQRTIALLITTLLAAPAVAISQQPGGERLFYVTSSPDAVASFEKNARSISIVGPQSYRVDAEGNLTGQVPASILAIARKHKVPVMPLIVNPGWNLELFHKLVNNSAARATMIASMVSLGKQHGFWGWQFDFEQIHVSDRDSLSRFYREAADALHANGMKVSIAVYPDPGDLLNASEYHTWLWDYLVGAYDLKALADAGDFITLMTYLQHTPRTPPGPVGGLPYMERVVRTALAQGWRRTSCRSASHSFRCIGELNGAPNAKDTAGDAAWAGTLSAISCRRRAPQCDGMQCRARPRRGGSSTASSSTPGLRTPPRSRQSSDCRNVTACAASPSGVLAKRTRECGRSSHPSRRTSRSLCAD